jgi:hypothetical protein
MSRPNKPASLANARALRRLLREAGHELRLDADEHLVLDPRNAELQAGAQAWLRRYRVPLVEMLRIEALLNLTGCAGEESSL